MSIGFQGSANWASGIFALIQVRQIEMLHRQTLIIGVLRPSPWMPGMNEYKMANIANETEQLPVNINFNRGKFKTEYV